MSTFHQKYFLYIYYSSMIIIMFKDESYVWTPLMMAARTGHYQICQLLLEHGAVLDLPQEVSMY